MFISLLLCPTERRMGDPPAPLDSLLAFSKKRRATAQLGSAVQHTKGRAPAEFGNTLGIYFANTNSLGNKLRQKHTPATTGFSGYLPTYPTTLLSNKLALPHTRAFAFKNNGAGETTWWYHSLLPDWQKRTTYPTLGSSLLN